MTDTVTNPENVTASAGRDDAITATALESYRRPWSVSIDDENCRAVIRDADGLEVAYISDVIRSRAGETAQMFVGLAEERDRLRDIVRRSLPFIEGDIDGVSTILGGAEMLQAAGEAPPKDLLEEFIADGRRVLREARAAIGEEVANG